MKDRRFDLLSAIVSFAAALIVLVPMVALSYFSEPLGWFVQALFVGLTLPVAALAGFGAVHLLCRLRRGMKIELPGLFTGGGAIFLALLFLAGAVGQIVYSLHLEQRVTYREETVQTTTPVVNGHAPCDIALLIDSSGSMIDKTDIVVRASDAFVDSLPDSADLALGIFTSKVTPSWGLRKMDAAGKEETKKNLREDGEGATTEIAEALEWAYDTLSAADDGTRNQFVVIVTDGVSPLHQSVIEKYDRTKCDIKVYSILTVDELYDSWLGESVTTKRFVDFVDSTGGFNSEVRTGDDEEAAIAELTKVFNNISSENITPTDNVKRVREVSTGLGFANGTILHDDFSVRIFGIIMRFVFFFIFAGLMQLYYFRDFRLSKLLICLGESAVATALVTLGGILGAAMISIIALALCLFALFAVLEIPEY